MSQKHAITWFKRDETGKWQWMGFEQQLQTDDDIVSWFDKLIAEHGGEDAPEIFVVDLEHLDELNGVAADGAAEELGLLRDWLDEVVQIDKITVEEEFSEYRARKGSAIVEGQ
jgi:GTP-dependent phosphoenolpyruvate carboxykinase